MRKKLLIIVTLCMICLNGTAQEKTYVIQRGETLQSIARKFGVNELRIRECNWNVKTYYAGLRIKLPAIAEEQTPDEVFANEMAHKKLDEAKKEMAMGKTYLALELLEKSLDYKFLDEAGFLAGKLNYEHQNYKKADKYFIMMRDSRTLTSEQQDAMDEMSAHIEQYYKTLRAERAERWRSFGESLVQGLQTTTQQMYAANAYNMQNNNMYAGNQTFGYIGGYSGPGLNPYYQMGTGSPVDDIMYNAYSEQQTMQRIRQSGNQLMQTTLQQQMNQYEPPTWDKFEKEYEEHVRLFKANGWIPLDKHAWHQQAYESSLAQNAATQEYITEMNKISDDLRASNRDIAERERRDRINHVKMYGDLKTGNYSGSGSYTSTSTVKTTPTNKSTDTPSSNTTTGSDTRKEEPTHREQYRNKKVYEEDYRDTRQKVTLYRRDGDKAYPDYHQMAVYEKQGNKYIQIDNQFYPIENCNWNGFKHYIHYKFMLYLNL